MLEVIGAGNPDYKGQDWGDVWASSEEHGARTREIEEIVTSRRNETTSQETKDDREYAMSVWTQMMTTTRRSFIAYWRSPEYLLVCFHQNAMMDAADFLRANSCFISSPAFSIPLHSGNWDIATLTCSQDCSLSS